MTTRTAKQPRQPAPLSEVLKYRNPRVVRGFLRQYDLDQREAERLFRELLKFLWLGGAHHVELTVFDFMSLLDEMWHQFVLHTHDYEQFCLRYFGRMLHHNPATEAPRRRQDPARARAELEQKLERFFNLVYDKLGSRTGDLWFDTFCDRYTLEFVDAHFIPYTRRLAAATGNQTAVSPVVQKAG